MKTELQNALFRKYPEIFKQRNYSIQESCMPWGIECDSGWYGIIDTLCKLIQQYVNGKNKSIQLRAGIRIGWLKRIARRLIRWLQRCAKIYYYNEFDETPVYVEAIQVKEKYGGLRFYISSGDDYVDGLICFAEELSYMTCEQCGSTQGVTQTRGWIYTLCGECLLKRDIAQYGGEDD